MRRLLGAVALMRVATRLLPEQKRLAARFPHHHFDAFFPGDGEDLLAVLTAGRWAIHRYTAPYQWVVRKQVHDDQYAFISNTEGDISFTDNEHAGAET